MLKDIFSPVKKQRKLTKDEAATMLQTTPENLAAFEAAYQVAALSYNKTSENLLDMDMKSIFAMANAAQDELRGSEGGSIDDVSQADIEKADKLVEKITKELLDQTLKIEDKSNDADQVQIEEVLDLPKVLQPQLTGTSVEKTFPLYNYPLLLTNYRQYLESNNPQRKKDFYNIFRQGLDIMDLDPIMYEMLGTNPISIGHWFPQLKAAVEKQTFFKVPETKIIKIPLPILQLSRLEYAGLTKNTLKVVNDYCFKAFELNENKSYFVKTGTYSSKFDFRNAKVTGAKEVHELGEYLLFISWQAVQMASPLATPCIYGVSTTNEWCVREYIEDMDQPKNPCIYKGMPLHTEYRVFVDFDDDRVLAVAPYWEPEMMKSRFSHGADEGSPHDLHDYVIYKSHEPILMERYEEHKDEVAQHIKEMLPNINLSGQWSIDVMQNGDDFWIIDMALAQNSALKEYIPKGELKITKENWIPKLERK